MREMVCIVCPKGCRLVVDDQGNVTGNFCPRGAKYGHDEVTCPMRNLTSTVKIISKVIARLPVMTDGDIPKDKIFAVMEEINKVQVKAPIHLRDVIIENVLNTGVNIVATRSIEE